MAKDTAGIQEKNKEAVQKDEGKARNVQNNEAGSAMSGRDTKRKDAKAETPRGKDRKGKTTGAGTKTGDKGKAAVAGKGEGKGKISEKGKAPNRGTVKSKIEAGKGPAGKDTSPAAVDIRDMDRAGKSDKSPGRDIPADSGKDRVIPDRGKDISGKSTSPEDKKDSKEIPAGGDAAKTGEGEIPPVPQVTIINPGDPSLRAMWPDIYERSSIFYWGKRKGMILEDDRGPVIDGVAGFISRYGTRITIEGLMRERKYTLLIDFVRFKDYNSAMYPTTLKIFIKNPETSNQELLDSLDYSAVIREETQYRKDIPYRYSVKGSVELTLREYSPMNGFWGIWDLAVTDTGLSSGETADGIKQPVDKEKKGNLVEKDHIVEMK